MGKTQFQYDETGTTYYYVFLTFLGLILIPSTYYFWPFQKEPEIDPEKKKKYMAAAAKGTVYAQACEEKSERLQQKGTFFLNFSNIFIHVYHRIISFFLFSKTL